MILAIDVQYYERSAFIAGVIFDDLGSASPNQEYLSTLNNIEDYESGNFHKRELPCILKMLKEYELTPTIIIVDGYVFLDGKNVPGLGKRLFDSLSHKPIIIGVAKKAFTGIGEEHELYRGKSHKPLYITSTHGLNQAKKYIADMHGVNRIPTLLKRTDRVCRDAANKFKHECEAALGTPSTRSFEKYQRNFKCPL